MRELEAAGVAFTMHEYERGESLRDFGLEAADKLVSTSIEKHVRAWEKPSDHVPVTAEFAFETT